MHAASELGKMSMCTCSPEQVFVVSVTQKSLEYFVPTLIIDQLQAWKNISAKKSLITKNPGNNATSCI